MAESVVEQPRFKKEDENISALEKLSRLSKIIADTGDYEKIKKFKVIHSVTTNPTLILDLIKNNEDAPVLHDAIEYGIQHGTDLRNIVSKAFDKLLVNVGLEFLKIIPGQVSTEIDARLSFDIPGTIKKAKELAGLYKEAGISSDRYLLKIASTWEGIEAAGELEKEGIPINMTLCFSLLQAKCSADRGVTVISPFVGRITDYFKEKENRETPYPIEEDPGVQTVVRIYEYIKKQHGRNYPNTHILAASFRTKEQILGLAGCDFITISPKLLEELYQDKTTLVERKLTKEEEREEEPENKILPASIEEKQFRWLLNEDEMATFKLAEGIRKFAVDGCKLETILRDKIATRLQLQLPEKKKTKDVVEELTKIKPPEHHKEIKGEI
jgi:transaldolase